MKYLALIVVLGFVYLGLGIPKVNTNVVEPKYETQAYALDKPIVASPTPQDSLEGVYLIQGATWHTNCQSQLEVVHQAVDSMGMGGNWYYMQYIFSNESCVDPGRLNSIGACGLPQALPCSKMDCSPGDIPCELNWSNQYALQRYGSWANSMAYWESHHNW